MANYFLARLGWSLITGSCPNSLWQECSETYNNGIQWHTMARWQVNMVYGEMMGKLSSVWWRTSLVHCQACTKCDFRASVHRRGSGFWLNLIPKGLRFGQICFNILWMEEILRQLVTIGNYKTLYIMGLQWDKPYTNWCRISSIHSMLTIWWLMFRFCMQWFAVLCHWFFGNQLIAIYKWNNIVKSIWPSGW